MGKKKTAGKTVLVKKKPAKKATKKTKLKSRTIISARKTRTDNIKILFAASEVYPLVKTGGLADVACYLPLALHDMGYDIRIILPAYRVVLDRVQNITTISDLQVPGTEVKTRLLRAILPDSDVIVYLVDVPELYDRPGDPYHGLNGEDWPDNAERFALFGQVITQICLKQAGLNWTPDILHCNDWHTGLAPALLKEEAGRPAIIYSIHTLSYQGLFSYKTFTSLNLPERLWSLEALEFYGEMSFIKGGLVFADKLITVSPGYAKEITTPEFGYGLCGLLKHRRDSLTGILNGVDYRYWDPRHDPLIKHHYWLKNLAAKKANKKSLQQEIGLIENNKAILLAYIGRLFEQKGIDLILDGLPGLLQDKNIQLVILGAGKAGYEKSLRTAAGSHAGQLALHIGYDESLAHRIMAGADALLMPSRFEPCGLTQLYSLRYGTIPVVRTTGGLADSVVDATETSLLDKTATGFHFENATTDDFLKATRRAVELFTSSKAQWRSVVKTAMKQEFSWESSAKQYSTVYLDVLKNVKKFEV